MSKFRLYHYTTVENLHKILECRQINPIEQIKGTPINPLVFLSCEKKSYDCSISSDEITKGEARIEVNTMIPGTIKWNRVKATGRIQSDISEYIDYLGTIKKGNPHNWYTCNCPLFSGTWVSIEIYKNGEWVLFNNPITRRSNAHEISTNRHNPYKDTFNEEKSYRKFNMRQWI